jgi:trehalose synthase
MDGKLQDYGEVVGQETIDEMRTLAGRLEGKRLQHINATAVGGLVAEILTRMVPVMRELGVETSWDIIKGDRSFYNVAQTFNKALYGSPVEITEEMFEIFRATTEMNCREMQIKGDVVVVHDPQPIGLIDRKRDAGAKWLWRCHVDASAPNQRVWNFLRDYVEEYDGIAYSMPDFAQQVSVPQYMIQPSIDPLSERNRELSADEIETVLQKYNIDTARPVLTQISRFDRLKDPLGVVAAYRMVKRRYNCQLILAGSRVSHDPDSAEMLRQVQEQAADDPDIHVIELPQFSDLEVNALVRGATIVFQKSIRSGFGLRVSEALWKRKPVIGGAVGAIKCQVVNGVTGFLVHSPEGAATRAQQLLADPDMRKQMGENGREHVRQNFLLTRHVRDYLLAMLALYHPGQDIVHL